MDIQRTRPRVGSEAPPSAVSTERLVNNENPSVSGRATVREAVFDLCRAFGMTTIFGNPGSTELPMFRDFPEDFRYVLGLNEAVAVAAADGFAQAGERAALVNLHSAAGLGHALGNVFTAFKNQSPLVITAGQQARSMLKMPPFLYAADATEFPKPYVKWSCEPARAEDVPAAIARAYYVAMQAPRGPTFVSIPVDDWDRPCEAVLPRAVSRISCGDPELLASAADALASALRPAIVVGAQAARDGAWTAIVELAERHQALVWVAPMSARNSFPEHHPLFAGFLPADREAIVEALSGHDLVLALGAPVFVYHVEGSGPYIRAGTGIFQLVNDPAEAAWAPIGTAIVTDIAEGVRSLLRGPPPTGRARAPAVTKADALRPERLSDAYLLQQIAALRPRGSIVVEEAPSSRPAMHRHLPMIEPNSFYTCASGGLGHGLPAAIGVALARPGEKVIAILGDGSSMYAIQGLWTAAELRLPISFIIVNNGCYEAMHVFGRHFGMDRVVGTMLPRLDFCKLAEAQGVASSRVMGIMALDDALHSSFEADGPTLIDVIVQ